MTQYSEIANRLIALGEALKNISTTIEELVEAVHRCGLRVSIDVIPQPSEIVENPVATELPPPYMQWDELGPSYKFQAIDKNGDVWAYQNRPFPRSASWNSGSGDTLLVAETNKSYTYWEKFLVERPQ